MAKHIQIEREAVVQGALRPAGWHGYVHEDEYERLVAEKALEPAPPPANPNMVVILAREAEVWGTVRSVGWHGVVSHDDYLRLKAAGAFEQPVVRAAPPAPAPEADVVDLPVLVDGEQLVNPTESDDIPPMPRSRRK